MEDIRYQELKLSGMLKGETNDCSVIAVAAATGCGYNKAFKALENEGRKPNRGATLTKILRATEALRYELVPAQTILTLIMSRSVSDVVPIGTIARHIGDEGTWLAVTRSHIACVRDGVLLDWTDGRRHQVKRLFYVRKMA